MKTVGFSSHRLEENMKNIINIEKELEKKILSNDFSEEEKVKAKIMIKIISEVMLLDGDRDISIAGIPYKAGWVKESFEEINAEDVKTVIKNLNRLRVEIRNKKTYIRTALYNAVNERALRNIYERQGTFDPEEAFNIALARSYNKKG